MKKLLTILFATTFCLAGNAGEKNAVSDRSASGSCSTNVASTNSNWRIEANKYPIHYCPQVYVIEKSIKYYSDR